MIKYNMTISGVTKKVMTYCEFITKYVLPEVRALIVKKLRSKYNMTQEQIARTLGITQAAVSYYISAKRGYKLKKFRDLPEVNKLIDEVVEQITRNEFNVEAYADAICDMCQKIRERKLILPLIERFGKKVIIKE